jgi:alpha-galactosidase
MELIPDRVEVAAGGSTGSAPLSSVPTLVSIGDLEVALDGGAWPAITWSVANRSDAAVRVRSVSVVFRVVGVAEPLRVFRNGYQSWSPTGVATFGVDRDPSTVADFEFLQAAHHADQRRARDDELRSEWVTLLADADVRGVGQPILAGFESGAANDGTLRVRRSADGGIEVWAEAFLGEAVLGPSEVRPLHGIVLDDRDAVDGSTKLGDWAAEVGRREAARAHAPYQVGWCSWYHYFHDVTEDHLRSNLALNAEWPFDVFQLDDGYQSAIGDWLTTNATFPSTLDQLASSIAAAGRTPGLWLAPFLVAPDAQVATRHPEWVARYVLDGVDKGPLRAWWNPAWEGGDAGFMYALDTTNPEVIEHLEGGARDLVDAGFDYLKLDFTFAPSVEGGWQDASMTPAQRVRAGYEAIRRGAGDDTFILGCGVPLANVVGVVDGNRIGQDVAPLWALPASAEVVRGYLGVQPSTQFAYGNTATRSFMHRRLWLNDPDCVMLRTKETDLSPDAARTWARAVGVSGGMALVSDDLALLDADARTLLDEVITIGRASDAAAIAGAPARADDLLERFLPGTLAAAGYELTTDTVAGTSTLTRPCAIGRGDCQQSEPEASHSATRPSIRAAPAVPPTYTSIFEV